MATEKASLDAQYKYLKEQLTAKNLTNAVKVIYTTTKTLSHPSNEGGDWELNETKQLQLHGDPNYRPQIEELQKCFTESEAEEIKSLAGADFNIECKEGHTLPPFKPVLKVFEEGTAKIEHKGEVLLIDVWATWCGPCQKPMSHNQEMLQKNEDKWGKNVRIVGVSVDRELDELKKRITDKKWTKIEHYYLGGWDKGHDLIQNFKIRGIPFVVLIDQKKKIVFKGHPSSINLEDKINELLDAPLAEQDSKENIPKKKPESTKVSINQEDFKKIKKYLKTHGTEGIFNEIKGINQIKISITKEKILENGEDLITYAPCDIFYEIEPKNEKNLNQVLFDLKSNFEDRLLTYSRKHIIDPKREIKEQIDWVLKTTEDIPNYGLTIQKKRVFFKQDARKDVIYEQFEPLRNSDIDEKTQKKLNELFEKKIEEFQSLNYDSTFTENLFYLGIQTWQISQQFYPFSKMKGVYLRDETNNLLQNNIGKPLLILFMSDDPKRILEFAKKQESDPTLMGIEVIGFQLENVLPDDTINELKSHNVKIPIYAPLEGYDYVPELEKYQLSSQDFSVGVSKFGKVCLQGVYSINKIAKMMSFYEKQTEEAYLQRKVDSVDGAKLNYKEVKTFLKSKTYAKIVEQINEENATLNFKLIFTLTKVISMKNQLLRYKKPLLQISIRETSKKRLEELVQELSKFNIKTEINYSPVIKIQKANECSICKKEILTAPRQYYNHFKKEFYCLECGDAENEGQAGLEKYRIKDNLVLINSENPDFLTFDIERLGKNLQPCSDEKISKSHSFSCNGGCRETPKDTDRWICLNCSPGLTLRNRYENYCNSCKNRIETTILNEQELEEVKKRKSHYNQHSLLRIRYSHGYYRF